MNTFTGVSLLELLRFYADRYLRITKCLSDVQLIMESPTAKTMPEQVNKTIKINLEIAQDESQELGLEVSTTHARDLLFALSSGVIKPHNIEALQETMRRELSCRFFVGVSPERKDYFCESRKGWEKILTAFPSATDDVEEMNKCFALCRYGAAVFHSLLVVERGLIVLGTKIDAKDHKVGWDATCRALQETVDAGYKKNQTGLPFNFLEQINVCAHAMKFAWRNKVNHAAGKLIVMESRIAPDVASDIISATHNFMNRLQEGGIKEPDWLQE